MKTRTLSSVIRTVATKQGINDTDAGKLVRSRIRAARRTNDTALFAAWPGLEDHSKGNRYPAIPVTLANKLIAGKAIVESRKA